MWEHPPTHPLVKSPTIRLRAYLIRRKNRMSLLLCIFYLCGLGRYVLGLAHLQQPTSTLLIFTRSLFWPGPQSEIDPQHIPISTLHCQHSVECIWAGAWSRKQHAAACSCRMLPENSAQPLLVSWRSLLGWFNSQATRWASRVLGYKNIQTATMQNNRTAGASAKSSIVQRQGWYPDRWLMYLPLFFQAWFHQFYRILRKLGYFVFVPLIPLFLYLFQKWRIFQILVFLGYERKYRYRTVYSVTVLSGSGWGWIQDLSIYFLVQGRYCTYCS